MDDNTRAQNMMEKLERIVRVHNPDLDELYNTLEELKRQSALLRRAEQQQLTLREQQITKRVDELIRIQFDDRMEIPASRHVRFYTPPPHISTALVSADFDG